MCCLYQKQLTLLLTEPAHTNEATRRWGRGNIRREVGFFEPAMNYSDFRPMLMVDQAIKLTTAIGANRHNEGAALDLLGQSKKLNVVVFLGSMDGETPSRSSQGMNEHRDFGRIGSKVRVQMLNFCL